MHRSLPGRHLSRGLRPPPLAPSLPAPAPIRSGSPSLPGGRPEPPRACPSHPTSTRAARVGGDGIKAAANRERIPDAQRTTYAVSLKGLAAIATRRSARGATASARARLADGRSAGGSKTVRREQRERRGSHRGRARGDRRDQSTPRAAKRCAGPRPAASRRTRSPRALGRDRGETGRTERGRAGRVAPGWLPWRRRRGSSAPHAGAQIAAEPEAPPLPTGPSPPRRPVPPPRPPHAARSHRLAPLSALGPHPPAPSSGPYPPARRCPHPPPPPPPRPAPVPRSLRRPASVPPRGGKGASQARSEGGERGAGGRGQSSVQTPPAGGLLQLPRRDRSAAEAVSR